MKLNVGLIGKGKWGSILKSKLSEIANLKFVLGKNKNYLDFIRDNKLSWIFVASPNNTHFEIVKNCLNLRVNVFCEKPLSTNYLEAEKLIKIAQQNKVKLYVSDIYSFHNKKPKKLLLINRIIRSKKIVVNDNEFYYRFMYHDISILFNFLKNYNIKRVDLKRSIKKKLFRINIQFKNNKFFLFEYCLNKKIKEHYINDINFITKKDILKKMLRSIIYGKVNIKANNRKALFILKFLDKIKKYSKI